MMSGLSFPGQTKLIMGLQVEMVSINAAIKHTKLHVTRGPHPDKVSTEDHTDHRVRAIPSQQRPRIQVKRYAGDSEEKGVAEVEVDSLRRVLQVQVVNSCGYPRICKSCNANDDDQYQYTNEFHSNLLTDTVHRTRQIVKLDSMAAWAYTCLGGGV